MAKSNLGMGLLLAALLIIGLMFIWPEAFGYLLLAAAIAAGLAVIGMACYVVYVFLHNRLSPVTRVEAQVLRKHGRDWDISIQGDTPEMQIARLGMLGRDSDAAWQAYSHEAAASDAPEIELAGGTDLYITFASRSKELKFIVPESVYTAVEAGDEGMLVYQGEKFKCFIPHPDERSADFWTDP